MALPGLPGPESPEILEFRKCPKITSHWHNCARDPTFGKHRAELGPTLVNFGQALADVVQTLVDFDHVRSTLAQLGSTSVHTWSSSVQFWADIGQAWSKQGRVWPRLVAQIRPSSVLSGPTSAQLNPARLWSISAQFRSSSSSIRSRSAARCWPMLFEVGQALAEFGRRLGIFVDGVGRDLPDIGRTRV